MNPYFLFDSDVLAILPLYRKMVLGGVWPELEFLQPVFSVDVKSGSVYAWDYRQFVDALVSIGDTPLYMEKLLLHLSNNGGHLGWSTTREGAAHFLHPLGPELSYSGFSGLVHMVAAEAINAWILKNNSIWQDALLDGITIPFSLTQLNGSRRNFREKIIEVGYGVFRGKTMFAIETRREAAAWKEIHFSALDAAVNAYRAWVVANQQEEYLALDNILAVPEVLVFAKALTAKVYRLQEQQS